MALPFFAGNEHIEDEVGDGDVIWCYLLRNLARSRPILQNQTPRGVSVTQCAHSPMVTGDPGATRVLIFYPCCSWNYFFNADDKQNHSDVSDVISQPGPPPPPPLQPLCLEPGFAYNPDSWESMPRLYKHTHTFRFSPAEL